MLLQLLRHLGKELLPLLYRRSRPCLQSILGRGNGLVEVLDAGNGGILEFLFGAGVDAAVDVGASAVLAVDGVVEGVSHGLGN